MALPEGCYVLPLPSAWCAISVVLHTEGLSLASQGEQCMPLQVLPEVHPITMFMQSLPFQAAFTSQAMLAVRDDAQHVIHTLRTRILIMADRQVFT